jgi:hypothetical protein
MFELLDEYPWNGFDRAIDGILVLLKCYDE